MPLGHGFPVPQGLRGRRSGKPSELRVRMRKTRAGLAPFIDEGVEVAVGHVLAPPTPRLGDELEAVVVELGERADGVPGLDDDLLAVEGRIDVRDDTDAPVALCRKDEGVRRRHLLVAGAERARFELRLRRLLE